MEHPVATFFYVLFVITWLAAACATIWFFMKSKILLDQMDDKS